MDNREIYNDPIIARKRKGDEDDPYKLINESLLVERNHALLTEIPNRFEKVKVVGVSGSFYEVENKILTENTYRVDYTNGVVFFHDTANGQTLTFRYFGEGGFYFPDSRIYLTDDSQEGTARDKFNDIDRAILEQKARVDEQIRSVPQPSEVVDMRIDHNGNVYPVAKDRIDALQIEIEDTYEDANGQIYSSLKERIDALQNQTGLIIDDLTGRLNEVESSITILPGQIELAVSELREDIDGDIQSINTTLNLIPGQLEAKVDVNGIIASLNLSEEGVRILGKLIHLDGQVMIDNAVIKSTHIESVIADKIKAGTLDSSVVTVRNSNSATKYTQIDGNGILVKGGAISIERPDGFVLINDGMMQGEFALQSANPPFRDTTDVTVRGQWIDVSSSSRRRIDRYTFQHAHRYLRFDVVRYVAAGAEGIIYIEDSGSGELLWSFTFNNNESHNSAQYLQSYNIDLGIPTGNTKSVIIRARTTIAGSPMSMHIGRVSLWG